MCARVRTRAPRVRSKVRGTVCAGQGAAAGGAWGAWGAWGAGGAGSAAGCSLGSVRMISEGVSTRMCASASRSPPAVTVTLGARTGPAGGPPGGGAAGAGGAAGGAEGGGARGLAAGGGAAAAGGALATVGAAGLSLSAPPLVLCRAPTDYTMSRISSGRFRFRPAS